MTQLNIYEIQLLADSDPEETIWGQLLSDMFHFAWVNGGLTNDTFDAKQDVSESTLALMAEYKRGLWVDLGDGDNTAVGSAYGDNFTMGSGTNYVDGGSNGGMTPWGSRAQDVLDVFVDSALTKVSVVAVTAADGAAYTQGYEYKVTVAGSDGVTFIKDVEGINVSLWQDKNGNGQRDWNDNPDTNEVSYLQFIPLAVNVNEIQIAKGSDPEETIWGQLLSDMFHFAWVNGGLTNDTFDAKQDVSESTLALMAEYKRGLWVDLGDGDNTAVGSAYGDNFTMGSGTNYVDGGSNGGMTPWGSRAQDVLDVFVDSALTKVSVVAVTAADGAAYTQGYEYKVTVAGSDGVTFIKDVEGINVSCGRTRTATVSGTGTTIRIPMKCRTCSSSRLRSMSMKIPTVSITWPTCLADRWAIVLILRAILLRAYRP